MPSLFVITKALSVDIFLECAIYTSNQETKIFGANVPLSGEAEFSFMLTQIDDNDVRIYLAEIDNDKTIEDTDHHVPSMNICGLESVSNSTTP